MIDNKEYARQLRKNAVKDENGGIRVSPELWEELARIIENSEEVKHGEWILHPDGSGTCKICNTHQKDIWDMDDWQNFCGHCGAKMDGKSK